MSKRVILVVLAFLPAWGGCASRQDSGIRIGDPGIRNHNDLSLWVANSGDSFYPESERPRLSNIEVWVAGSKCDARANIVVFNSKLGWSERADFSVPESATSAQVRAQVTSGKRLYLVTQNWEKRAERWTVENHSIQPASN